MLDYNKDHILNGCTDEKVAYIHSRRQQILGGKRYHTEGKRWIDVFRYNNFRVATWDSSSRYLPGIMRRILPVDFVGILFEIFEKWFLSYSKISTVNFSVKMLIYYWKIRIHYIKIPGNPGIFGKSQNTCRFRGYDIFEKNSNPIYHFWELAYYCNWSWSNIAIHYGSGRSFKRSSRSLVKVNFQRKKSQKFRNFSSIREKIILRLFSPRVKIARWK